MLSKPASLSVQGTEIKEFIKLECKFQNYEWGKIGSESLVYNLYNEGKHNKE